MTTKKRSTRKKSLKSSSARMQSFRLEKDTVPFTSMRLTRQTLYWIVLVMVIVAFQLWIIKLQIDIGNLIELLDISKIS